MIMKTRQIQIPKIESYLTEIQNEIDEAQKWLDEADNSISTDEDTYANKVKFIKLWKVILNDIDEWERNFFIYDYKNLGSINEKAETIHLNPNSYRVYQCNIRKHIRAKFI